MADRAVSAVIGKALEASIVVLYIGLLTTTLYAGVLPEYRTAAATEVTDRTLADASGEIGTAIPQSGGETTARVDVPTTIRGETYRLHVREGSLVLDHPHPTVGDRTPLVLPESVVSIEGEWHSADPAVVRVEATDDGYAITLETGDP